MTTADVQSQGCTPLLGALWTSTILRSRRLQSESKPHIEATGTKMPNACWHHWHFSAFWTELCYHERLQCASNCSLNPWRANPFPPHLSGAGSEGTKTIFTLFKNQQSKAYPLKRVIRQVGEHQKIFSLSIPISVVCITKSKRMNSFEKRH